MFFPDCLINFSLQVFLNKFERINAQIKWNKFRCVLLITASEYIQQKLTARGGNKYTYTKS